MGRRRPRSKTRLRPAPVQAFLTRSNITRREMAHLVGISPAYFSQLMSGERNPSEKVRAGLQQVMGVEDFDELFYVEDDDGV